MVLCGYKRLIVVKSDFMLVKWLKVVKSGFMWLSGLCGQTWLKLVNSGFKWLIVILCG